MTYRTWQELIEAERRAGRPPVVADADFTLFCGDALVVLRGMPDGSADCVITSPPYWGLRDYGTGAWDGGNPGCDHVAKRKEPTIESSSRLGYPADGGRRRIGTENTYHEAYTERYRDVCGKCGARRVDQQLGLEETPESYVARIVEVFREVRRVLAPHGTCWVNLGSTYASGGSGPSPSRRAPSVPAYGSDGTAPQDSRAPGSAYPDLCDGCRDATQSHRDRIAGTVQPLGPVAPPPSLTGRGNAPAGSAEASPDASPLAAPASTTPKSLPLPPAACSHCANCGACLSVLRSTSRDARLCAHTAAYTNGTAPPAWASHIPGTDAWGTACLNYKAKDLVPIPWLVAMALQADGWWLRSDIVWWKPNPMPSSVTDRPTPAHEYVFLLTKRPRYFFDAEAVREPHSLVDYTQRRLSVPRNRGESRTWTGTARAVMDFRNPAGRNVRSVWEIATQPFPEAHFATYPEELVRRCLLAGCPEWVCRVCGRPRERIGWSDCGHGDFRPGVILDPFLGSGTTALVARKHGRRCVGIELNEDYARMAARRLGQLSLLAEGT